jgi:large subunit ribosomal protein L34e
MRQPRRLSTEAAIFLIDATHAGMVRPSLRSRSLRRAQRRTPGGRAKTYYYRRFASPPRGAITGEPIQGIGKMPKGARRGFRPPARPYGGYVSHRVLERALRLAVRS